MLTSLALIIFALALGGLLIKFNIIGVIITKIEESVKGIVGLTISAALTCIGVNLLVGEHYLAINTPLTLQGTTALIAAPASLRTRVRAVLGKLW